MGRKPTIANEDLIRTARRVFLFEGSSAPTARIAEACGISEGTLFKRFGTKEALFSAAMKPPPLDPVLAAIRNTSLDESARMRCIRISTLLVEFFLEVVPRMATLFASGSLQPGALYEADPKPPMVLLEALEEMFRSEMTSGRIQSNDPEAAARMMLSTSHNLAVFETMGIESPRTVDQRMAYVTQMVNLFPFGDEQKGDVCRRD